MEFTLSQSMFDSARDTEFGDLVFVTEMIKESGTDIRYRYYYEDLILEISIVQCIDVGLHNKQTGEKYSSGKIFDLDNVEEDIIYSQSRSNTSIQYEEDDLLVEYISSIHYNNGNLNDFIETIIGFNEQYKDKLMSVKI